ncbi:MAG: CBS domain-containing protein [Polyangiaceae bacterium]
MKRNDPIKTIMTRDAVTVQVGEQPSRVRALLEEERFHHLPVLDGRKLVGIVSTVDFMKAGFSAWGADARTVDAVLDSQLRLADLMHSEPQTIRDTATVRDAAHALAHGKFHSLPVVDADGKLAGIVTSTDLIRYLLEQY